MSIDSEIKKIEYTIKNNEKTLEKLRKRYKSLIDIKTLLPDAEYLSGIIASKSVNNEVSCMKLEFQWAGVFAKFHINPNTYGRPVYASPYLFKIASIINSSHWQNRERSIEIFDYEKMIPEECKRKKKFLKRIKVFLIKKIQSEKLVISDNSFNKDYFKKILMLS